MTNMSPNFSLSTLKRRLKAMNIRRHDEGIRPEEVMQTVRVSTLSIFVVMKVQPYICVYVHAHP